MIVQLMLSCQGGRVLLRYAGMSCASPGPWQHCGSRRFRTCQGRGLGSCHLHPKVMSDSVQGQPGLPLLETVP